GTESVDVDLGKPRFDVGKQVEIPLLGELWMMAALHQDLGAAQRDGFLDLFVYLIERDDIGIVVLLCAVERAKFAIDVADVGVINVPIDVVGADVVAVPAEIRGFGELTTAIG